MRLLQQETTAGPSTSLRSGRDDSVVEHKRFSFFGLGGAEMRAAGCNALVHAESVAHMGITEVLRHAPNIYRKFQLLKQSLRSERPGVAVLIDFPDVNFRLAKEARRLGIPVVWLVSPQLWAWKKRRLRWVQQRVTKMLVIFPFEEQFYRERGVPAEFIGHPLADLPMPSISREEFAAKWGLDARKHWIALLPGSRERELRLNLPGMLDAARRLGPCFEFVLPVAATLSRESVLALLEQRGISVNSVLSSLSFRSKAAESVLEAGREEKADSSASLRNDNQRVLRNDSDRPRGDNKESARITLTDDARATLFHARASVVASGTATVQAALLGNPFVIVYRMSALSYWIARRFVSVAFAGMPNLIAGREIIPELLQDRFTGSNVADALEPLLRTGPERDRQMADLRLVAGKLRLTNARLNTTGGEELPKPACPPDNQLDTANAMARAARAVLELLPK